MTDFETIQEEVLTELFGTTNFASTIRGLFTGKTPDSALNPPKKILDRKLNAANRIQQASGFLNDRSLDDVDIPTYLRQAMSKYADASKPEQSALRTTGYKAGPPGHNKLGKVGVQHDEIDAAAAKAAVEKRRAVYAGKSYASIRETLDQTIRRLLSEMRNSGGVLSVTSIVETDGTKSKSAWDSILPEFRSEHAGWTKAGEYACTSCTTQIGKNLKGESPFGLAREHATKHEKDLAVTEAVINKIVDELLEAFMYDPKHHFTGGKEGGVPGPLTGMKFDTLQRALDAGSQLTPTGQPMGDWNHVIVAPEEEGSKQVNVPQPPAEAAPEGEPEDKINPMSRIQPIAAPVR